jgi:hypothetical protein
MNRPWNKSHGATSGGHQTREYKAWLHLRARCENKSARDFARYGGRGIKVCGRWASFENFMADMGPRPSADYSIDRINVDGNYEPNNCRWATQKQQQMNRRDNIRISAFGRTMLASEWSAETGLKERTIMWRIRHGWSHEKAVSSPLMINGSGLATQEQRDAARRKLGL